ncbi:secreted RxLR effector peptide protein, putative [Phytophthora infestans T30-4]|uniref:Secreted RxLR effector peptide protein n=2 Tax=Phytophthora infestans TaxID=4787 RepID=A0A8S9U6F3_PHYIN
MILWVSSSRIKSVYSGPLLATVTLLIFVGLALGAANVKVEGTDVDLKNNIRLDRRLRTLIANSNYSPEDRGVSSIKELAQTISVDKLAKSIKTLVAPDSQTKIAKRFNKIKGKGVESNVLLSDKFDGSASYVLLKVLKGEQAAADKAIFATLATHYGDAFLPHLLEAKRMGKHSIVSRLETIQRKNWMGDGKSVDDVYRILKLDEEGQNILKSPALSTWMSYASKLKEDPLNMLLLKLRAQYDDAVVLKMIAMSKDKSDDDTFRKLEGALMGKWRQDGKTADDVFRLLKLDEEGSDLLRNPLLKAWVSYAGGRLRADPYTHMISVLRQKKCQ